MAYNTVGDLIRAALGKLVVIGTQETLTDADMQSGLDAINGLLDSWWTQSLAVYTIEQQSYAATAGVGTYAIGTGQTWNATRPVKIVNAFARYQNVDYPIRPIDRVQFDGIPYKTVGGIPMVLFYDREYPVGNVTLYPIPSVAMDIYLDTFAQVQSFATYNDAINLPPGYARALIFNLAVEIADDYGKPVTPNIQRQADLSLGNLKRLNRQDQLLKYDYALLYNSLAYNVYSDTYR
jgi:hypothetical protein